MTDLRTRDFLSLLGADDLGQLVGDVEFLLQKHFLLETEIFKTSCSLPGDLRSSLPFRLVVVV